MYYCYLRVGGSIQCLRIVSALVLISLTHAVCIEVPLCTLDSHKNHTCFCSLTIDYKKGKLNIDVLFCNIN